MRASARTHRRFFLAASARKILFRGVGARKARRLRICGGWTIFGSPFICETEVLYVGMQTSSVFVNSGDCMTRPETIVPTFPARAAYGGTLRMGVGSSTWSGARRRAYALVFGETTSRVSGLPGKLRVAGMSGTSSPARRWHAGRGRYGIRWMVVALDNNVFGFRQDKRRCQGMVQAAANFSSPRLAVGTNGRIRSFRAGSEERDRVVRCGERGIVNVPPLRVIIACYRRCIGARRRCIEGA